MSAHLESPAFTYPWTYYRGMTLPATTASRDDNGLWLASRCHLPSWSFLAFLMLFKDVQVFVVSRRIIWSISGLMIGIWQKGT